MSTVRYPGLSLVLPDSWADETVPTFVGRRADGFFTNIVCTRVLQGERLGVETHARKQLATAREALVDYRIHAEEALEHRGCRGYKVLHSFAGEEGRQVTQLQLYLEQGEHVLVLTASAASSAFEELRSELEEILASVQLAESPT